MSEVKAYRGLAREMSRERKAIWFEPLGEVHVDERRMQSPEPREDGQADVDRALEGASSRSERLCRCECCRGRKHPIGTGLLVKQRASIATVPEAIFPISPFWRLRFREWPGITLDVHAPAPHYLAISAPAHDHHLICFCPAGRGLTYPARPRPDPRQCPLLSPGMSLLAVTLRTRRLPFGKAKPRHPLVCASRKATLIQKRPPPR